MPRARAAIVALITCLGRAEAADPIVLGAGRLTVSGDASFGLAPRDKGYFNESAYRRNLLRTTRLGLALRLQAGDHLALLSELRSDNLDAPRAYALYLRLRPWKERAFDVQAGRIPPVFGAFARRRYGPENPLVSFPLAYQYLTTLRPDAVPASADELLAVRGGGWAVRYNYGEAGFDAGIPLVQALRWDTGVEARLAGERLELAAAVTQGTLSIPRVEDDNRGKQLSARVALRPRPGLVLGLSAARGPWLARRLERAWPSAGGYHQRAFGADAEYSRGYGLLRAEAVFSEWELPAIGRPALPTLRSHGIMLEGRYKLLPGLYVAGRADHLGFSEVQGSYGRQSWDAPVTRLEAGLGWTPARHALLKLAFQHNRRDAGRVRRLNLVAAQALLWF